MLQCNARSAAAWGSRCGEKMSRPEGGAFYKLGNAALWVILMSALGGKRTPHAEGSCDGALQHRTESREQVLPEPQGDPEAAHIFAGHTVTLSKIFVLARSHGGGKSHIVKQDIVLEI